MTRPIDAVAAIQQPVRLQDMLHSAQRQAQIPQQAQQSDTEREKALAQDRVERDEALQGQVIRDDEPHQQQRRERNAPDAEEGDSEATGHIDLLA